MNSIKPALLISAAILAGCGGGTGGDGLAQSQDMEAPKFVAVSAAGTPRTSSWVTVNEGAGLPLGKNSQAPMGLAAELSAKTAKISGDYYASSADGVIVNLETAKEGWKTYAKAALEAGQVLVLESSGSGDSALRVQKASEELTGLGVAAAALMIYQEEAGVEAYSVMPFGPNEMRDLAALMARVVKRNSSPTSPESPK